MVSLDILLHELAQSPVHNALILDGEAFRSANTVATCDSPHTDLLKTASIVCEYGDLFVPCGLSALWVHGIISEPQRHTVAMRSLKRSTFATQNLFDVRDYGSLSGKTIDLGGFAVVRVHAALEQVLRDPRIDEVQLQNVLVAVSWQVPKLLAEVHTSLAKYHRVPYTELALQRISLR